MTASAEKQNEPRAVTARGFSLVLVVAAALINDQGEILLTQRPAGKSMAGLWEFPGGKIEKGESPETALARELEEELAIQVNIKSLKPVTFASHIYEDFHLLMPLYAVKMNAGIRPQEGQKIRWVRPEELDDYDMPPADIPLLKPLKDFVRHIMMTGAG